MDLEAYTSANRADWNRLRQLSRTPSRLSADEVDEMAELYSQTSTQLSVVQTQDPDGVAARSLSLVLAKARHRLTGKPANFSESFTRFFTISLPYAFYQIRWLTLILGALFCLVAFAFGAWLANNPDIANATMPPEMQEEYVNEAFVNYYSEHPASSFAGMVWTNNAWIAAQEVALGVTGFWVPYILYANAESVGRIAGIMTLHDELDTFFMYILPHGLMEITAIFIAGAAGLRIFWAWVAPGRKTRMQSLAYHGRSLITVAIGLVIVLFISGLVEAYVTPSSLPVWLKILIGALVLAGYWVYTLVLGGRVARAGLDAEMGEYDGGRRVLTA